MSSLRRKPHILFVCTANLNRSPTAELLYQRDPRIEVRSAGVSELARTPVDERLLRWADWVIAMEDEHLAAIRRSFPQPARETHLVALDIPDVYQFQSLSLVREIRDRFEPHLERILAGEDAVAD